MYGAAQAVPGGGGDWWTYLGPFIPAALLGLAVIAYLVRKLDQAQTENKELSERLIAQHEVQAPLIKDAIDIIGQQGDVISENTVELRRAREDRDRGRT